MTGLTMQFVEAIISTAKLDLSEVLQGGLEQNLFTELAGAISNSNDPAVEAVMRLGQCVGGRGAIPVVGREEHLDVLFSATTVGLASQLGKIRRREGSSLPSLSSAVLGAAFALGVDRDIDGSLFLSALFLGSEAERRIAGAMSSSHFDAGWDPVGTCGVLGAAIAGALICGLDAERFASALGTAASSTIGQRGGRGTMLEGFHAGKAASNGVLAAMLAEADFNGSLRVLEAPRGFFSVLSESSQPDEVLSGFGSRWLISEKSADADAEWIDRMGSLPAEFSQGRALSLRTAVEGLAEAESLAELVEASIGRPSAR